MCVNCNDSLQVNLPVAPSGLNGTDGQSAYVYIATANTNTGTGFTYPMNPTQPYIAIITTTTPIVNPVAGDFTGQWHYWVGPSGAAGTNGTNGTNGADGVNGAISLNYKWSNNVTSSPPAAGYVKTSNATIASSTALYINISDANSVGVGNVLARMLSSTSSTKSIISITKKGTPTVFAHFAVTGGTLLSGTYYVVTVTGLSSSSATPFSLDDNVVFSFSVVGDVGNVGVTGATGPMGPQGPAGPAGSSTIARPAANNIDVDFNTSLDTSVSGDYYTFSGTIGPGLFTANTPTVPTTTSIITISNTSGLAVNNSSILQYLSSTYFSGSQLITFTDTASGDDASYLIRQVIWNGTSVTLYVTYDSGALSSFGIGDDFEIAVSTDYQVVLDNVSYNRVLLKNNSGVAKNVRFKAPTAASPGATFLVEVVADTGNASQMNLAYVYNSTGSLGTLVESWEYANRPSDGTITPSVTNLNLLNAGESCLLQFLVVPGGLAFIGGDKFVR